MKRVALFLFSLTIFISCSGYNAVINQWSLIRGIDQDNNDFHYSGTFSDTIRTDSKSTLFKHNEDIYELNNQIERIIDEGKKYPELKIDSTFIIPFADDELTFYKVKYYIGKSEQTFYYTKEFGIVLRMFSRGRGIGLIQISRAKASDTSRIDMKPILRNFINRGIIKN